MWVGLSGDIPIRAKEQGEEEKQRENLDSHTVTHYNSPIEKGRKDSFFLNCPFSRKCSGLKVSGVAHSFGSLCSAVKLVRITVPWRRQPRFRWGYKPCSGDGDPWSPAPKPCQSLITCSFPNTSPWAYCLRLLPFVQERMRDCNCRLEVFPEECG